MVTKATQMVYRRNAKWLFSLLALIIALPILLPANALSAWNDVTASVALSRTRPLYNYIDKVTYLNGSLTNTSGESFQAPIRLVIDSVTTPQVTVHNADGVTDDGKPYFDFSGLLGDGTLDPGETSSARQLDFYNPNRLRFNFTVKVFVEAQAEVVLESLSVSPASMTLTGIGASQQLTVTGSYSNGTTRDLTPASTGTTYESSDVGVALVGTDGMASVGTTSGTAVVTATNSGICASCQVEVSIDVTPPVVTITTPINGATVTSPQITMMGNIEDESPIQSAFINGVPLSLDGINFSVQVDLAAGANTIEVTATDAYGNVGSDSVSVTYVVLESLSVSPPSVTMTRAGETQQLTITGTYSDGSTQDLTPASAGTGYTSSNTNVAAVSPDGLVTAGTANGTATITATNTGKSASCQIEVQIDVTLPVVTITAPKDGVTLTSPQANVLGTIEDESPIESAFINDVPLTLEGMDFTADVDLVEGVNPITVTATDAYGNVGSTDISVTYVIEAQDTTPPVITITAPKDIAHLNQTPVTVTGTVQDASPIKSLTVNGQTVLLNNASFSLDVVLAEGTNTITATAIDDFDNIGSDTVTVILDTTPPLLTIESVPPLTNKTELPVRGTSEPGAALALTGGVNPVSGPTDQVSGGFSLPVDLHQNAHNILSVTASDSLGNTCLPKTLEIDQDSTPPNVVSVTPGTGETVFSQNIPCRVTFSEPVTAETVALGTSFQVTCEGAAVNGSLTISQDNQIATFMPEGALPLGSQLDILITSAIKDPAGNQMAVPFISHFFTPQEIGASVVTGEVYDDTRGLLLAGAMAKLLSTNGVPLGEDSPIMVTGADGLFTLEVSPGTHTILISKDGCTSVERTVEVAANASATLLDTRLTPIDPKTNQINGLAGGTAVNDKGDVTLELPEDCSSNEIELRITEVSQQGIKNPLPLGWSPVMTVNLAGNVEQFRNPATLTLPMPSGVTDLGSVTAVRWDGESGAWKVLSPPQMGAAGRIELSIRQLGQFSLILADQGMTSPPVPETGNVLEGAAPVAYPAGISGEGIVVPAVIMAGEDGHARANATLMLPEALPSGTLFEAKVMETFTLTSSEEVLSQPFVQDLHFYAWPDDGNPLTLCVEFPVTPSKQYALGELFLGKVDLFIREPHVAATHIVGPVGGEITTDEGLDVSIPSGCLDRNTTLNAQTVPESLFGVPVPSGQTYLGGFSIDFGGVSLLGPVQVALPILDSMVLPPEPVIVMARVGDFEGIPGLFLVGLGQMAGDLVQSLNELSELTFPGIDRAGQYGFFLVSEPIGLLQGIVTAVNGQISTNAVISHDLLPFLAKVDENGRYIQVGYVDELKLIAKNPVTNDQGTTTATITSPNEVVNSNIAIQQIPPEVVSVSPVNGVANVPVTTSVTVTFSEPVTGIDTDTFQLKDPAGNAVAGQLSITVEAKTATFYPDASLASESLYTLHLNPGIHDKAGYVLSGFNPTSFTTVDLTPPVFEGELSVSMPDENGYATVTGTPGTAEPTSVVYIINNTSGMVVTISMPSSTDGSFSEQILADISDEIIVTIVDAGGNSTTLNPGPFVDETTGAVVVGPEGGTVKGEGGVELDIPAGALPYAAVVTIEPVTEPFELPTDLLEYPDVVAAFEENYEFVQSVKIDTDGVEFNEPVGFSIPAPSGATPEDTFIVVRPIEVQVAGELFDAESGELLDSSDVQTVTRFEVVDSASVKEIDGEWRLSTDSPFVGILGVASAVYTIYETVSSFTGASGLSKLVVIQGVVEDGDHNRVAGAVVTLIGGPVTTPFVAVATENGFFSISAPATFVESASFLFNVRDPYTGSIQYRQARAFNVFGRVFYMTIVTLSKPLETPPPEILKRDDTTAPTIHIDVTAATLWNNVVEVGDGVAVSVQVSDNRPGVGIPNITLNGHPKPSSFSISNIPEGMYDIYAEVGDSVGNVATASRTIQARSPGQTPEPTDGVPIVLSTNIPDEATDIPPISYPIIIDFNEPLNISTVNSSTIYLVLDDPFVDPYDPANHITGEIRLVNQGMAIIFVPSINLEFGKSYRLYLSGVRDSTDELLVYATNGFTTFTTALHPLFVRGRCPLTNINPKDLELKAPYVLITDADQGNQGGLTVVNASNPFSPSEVTNNILPLPLRYDRYSSFGIALNEDKKNACIVTTGMVRTQPFSLLSTFEVIDVSTAEAPNIVADKNLQETITMEGAVPYRVVVSKVFTPSGEERDYAFVAWLNFGFQVIDISGQEPNIIGAIRVPGTHMGRASDLDILGNYVYMANGHSGELLAIDVTEIGGPSFVDDNPVDGVDDRIAGRLTTIPGRAWRVKVVDEFRFTNPATQAIEYKDLAVVSCYDNGIAIVDISDPQTPSLLSPPVAVAGTVYNLDVDKQAGLIVAATGSEGLQIIDIKDPYNPRVIGGLRAYPAPPNELQEPALGGLAKNVEVSRNGLAYVLTENELKIVYVRPFSPECEDDSDGGCLGPCCEVVNTGNSAVGYRTGKLTVDHYLPATRFMGISNSIGLGYTSTSAYPSRVIAAKTDLEPGSVLPDTLGFNLEIAGIRKEVKFEPNAGQSRQTFLFDGIDDQGNRLPTGSYPYVMSVSNDFDTSSAYPTSLPADIEGRAIIINGIESPFGAGWSLKGLQKLHFSIDGTVTLTDGLGGAIYFTPGQVTSSGVRVYVSPENDFSELARHFDDTFIRTLKDGIKVHFDSSGWQTSVVDRNGNTISYLYQGDRLVTIINSAGQETHFSYNGAGHLESVTDPASRVTTFNIDANGDLISITNPDGSVVSYTYDANHLLTAKTGPRGYATRYEYDNNGRISKTIAPTGEVREFEPSSVQGLINDLEPLVGTPSNPAPIVPAPEDIFTDGKGNTTKMKTNRFGALLEMTDPLGHTTLYERECEGGCAGSTKITRPNGAISRMTYDARGNLLSRTQENVDATTSYAYDGVFNQITSITDPKGNVTSIEYDDHGNPTRMTDALGNSTTMTYDNRGLLTSITDAIGNTTSFIYDAAANFLSVTNPLGHTTSYIYDAAGNVLSVTDAEGHVTSYTYDSMNRLLTVTDAADGVTRYAYDAAGNLKGITDAKGQTTIFDYNEISQLVKTVNPSGLEKTYAYDANRSLDSTTDAKGQTIQLKYDNAGRLIEKILPGEVVTHYGYDSVGNLVEASNPDSKIFMGYDAQGRLMSTTTIQAGKEVELTYTYDVNGNRLTMTDPTGTTRYEYDTLNRLTSLANPSEHKVTFEHDKLGKRIRMLYPNGVVTTYEYDEASQLKSLAHKSGETVIASLDYSYNNIGNRATMTDLAGVHNYTYDNLSQLIEAAHPQPFNPTERFTYDAVGNRLTSATVPDFVNIHDQANRLLEDESYTYGYDDNGNLVRKQEKLTGDLTVYIYDAENRLTRIEFPSGTYANYRYDALWRRIERSINGIAKRYVYDGEDIVLEIDGTNKLKAYFTHGPGIDEPLIMETDVASNTTFGKRAFYHADMLGNIKALTDPTGVIIQTYVYDSFGKIVERTGSLMNPYRYTGREFDSESGLYYYRARYYDPVAARFMTEDPLEYKGGINLYAYVLNDPINFVDPYGYSLIQKEWQDLKKRWPKGVEGLSKWAIKEGLKELDKSRYVTVSHPENIAKSLSKAIYEYLPKEEAEGEDIAIGKPICEQWETYFKPLRKDDPKNIEYQLHKVKIFKLEKGKIKLNLDVDFMIKFHLKRF